jgi:prolyl-tRNA synthetase
LTETLGDLGVRAVLDDRTDQSFGRRTVDWELKGVPVRVEVGPRDLAEGKVTVVRRDSGQKEPVALADAGTAVAVALEDVQQALLDTATARLRDRTATTATLDEAAEAAQEGFARVPWAEIGPEGEARLAERSVSVRCLQRPDGSVPDSGDEGDLVAFVARAY